jgi:hypothetical protein
MRYRWVVLISALLALIVSIFIGIYFSLVSTASVAWIPGLEDVFGETLPSSIAVVFVISFPIILVLLSLIWWVAGHLRK